MRESRCLTAPTYGHEGKLAFSDVQCFQIRVGKLISIRMMARVLVHNHY